MKKALFTLFIAICLSAASQSANAQERGFGIGVAAGGPDGISYKTWTGDNAAIAGLISFSISENTSSFYTHADYLVHRFYDELDWEVGRLHYYYGGGVGFQWRDHLPDDQFSLRLPTGFGFNFTDVPVDIFFELAPTFDLSPDFSFRFNGNFGFRFYLN